MSSCCDNNDHAPMVQINQLPNPNPKNFEILRTAEIKEFTIIEIKYPDCTNYEGRKILVYKAASKDVINQKIIDPHFCDGNHLSPVARFEPTEFGWEAAKLFADKIMNVLDSIK